MPRQTPEQLVEAKRRRAEERQQEQERREAEEAERERHEQERRVREQELHDQHDQLRSYVVGIYDELSKISAKWPTQEVSNLTVQRANRAIRDTKKLLADDGDEFLDEINEFVPAGDPPEARDVVMTLRQIKDALARMETRHHRIWLMMERG